MRLKEIAVGLMVGLGGLSYGGNRISPQSLTLRTWGPLIEGHNRERALVALPPLQWSEALAQQAQAWADHCDFSHDPDLSATDSGQNLYVTSQLDKGVHTVGGDAAEAWASEKKNYDPEANRCAAGKVCGHYTQMVWRGTTEVGCAVTYCSQGIAGFGKPGTNVVCDYEPAGNYIGQKPY
jgi:hypothetical protein